MLGAVARHLGVPDAVQVVDDLLAHLLGDDADKDQPVGFPGPTTPEPGSPICRTIPQNFTLTHFYNVCIFIAVKEIACPDRGLLMTETHTARRVLGRCGDLEVAALTSRPCYDRARLACIELKGAS